MSLRIISERNEKQFKHSIGCALEIGKRCCGDQRSFVDPKNRFAVAEVVSELFRYAKVGANALAHEHAENLEDRNGEEQMAFTPSKVSSLNDSR